MQFRVDRSIKGILFIKTFPPLITFYSSVCVAWMKLIFTGDNIFVVAAWCRKWFLLYLMVVVEKINIIKCHYFNEEF